jgi:cation transport regulator ChaB
MSNVVHLYQTLIDLLYAPAQKIKVETEFHKQVSQVKGILNDDRTSFISSILEFMIHAGNVPINVKTTNSNLDKIYEDWKRNVNANLNLDIPRGMRSLTEQYWRERLTSSLLCLRIRWSKIDGYIIPTTMYFADGGSIYAKNKSGKLNTTTYYLGEPKDKENNILDTTDNETILIRKPYTQWTSLYPTPYLNRKGATYHALFKFAILDKFAEFVNTVNPYQQFIRLGCEAALAKSGMMPTPEELKDVTEKYQQKVKEAKEHPYAKGFVGATPFDHKLEDIVPPYEKVLNENHLKMTDKNILASLGMIEFKGFSSNREEAILNPKVLIEEIIDGVLDWVELLTEVTILTQQKNGQAKKFGNLDVRLSPGMIKSFVTDDMRALIRSWYDRGLISKKSAVESTTLLDFEIEVTERDRERKDKLNERMYPQVTQNLEQNPNDYSNPGDDNIPEVKKPGSPESKNFKSSEKINCPNCEEEIDYVNEPEKGMGYIACPGCGVSIDQEGKVYKALEEHEVILEPIKDIRKIPNEIRQNLSAEQEQIFKEKFNEEFVRQTALQTDNFLRQQKSIEFANEQVYLEAPYTKTSYPPQLKNLPTGARNLFIRTFNRILEETGDENLARRSAWSNVKKRYFKDSDGTWKKRKT